MKNNFAVCILSYNRENYLDRTLRSFDEINFQKKYIFLTIDQTLYLIEKEF